MYRYLVEVDGWSICMHEGRHQANRVHRWLRSKQHSTASTAACHIAASVGGQASARGGRDGQSKPGQAHVTGNNRGQGRAVKARRFAVWARWAGLPALTAAAPTTPCAPHQAAACPPPSAPGGTQTPGAHTAGRCSTAAWPPAPAGHPSAPRGAAAAVPETATG